MHVVVITPPAPIVTWAEAQAHLKLDGDDEKLMVEGMIAAASSHIDGPSGWLGCAVGLQELEVRFDTLNVGQSFRLPYPPIVDLLEIRYFDARNVEQLAELADFVLFDGVVSPEGSSWVWEGGSLRRDAVRLQYRAGYENVPAAIKAAILLMVGDMHRFRSSASDMNITPASIPMAATVSDLLQPFRVYC